MLLSLSAVMSDLLSNEINERKSLQDSGKQIKKANSTNKSCPRSSVLMYFIEIQKENKQKKLKNA